MHSLVNKIWATTLLESEHDTIGNSLYHIWRILHYELGPKCNEASLKWLFFEKDVEGWRNKHTTKPRMCDIPQENVVWLTKDDYYRIFKKLKITNKKKLREKK